MTNEADTLPPPLVPAHVILRDFGFMPLEVLRLRDSDLASLASGEEFKAAVLLWCASWHQMPAGSLPDDDRLLWKYAGAEGMERWAAVRQGALRGFVKCADGRLYHPVIAQRALIAWAEKLAREARTKAATEAKKRAARDVERDEKRDVDRDDDRNELQGKGSKGKGREVKGERKRARGGAGAGAGGGAGARTGARAREGAPPKQESSPPPPEIQPQTLAAAACRAMREAGLEGADPGDPRLLALLAQGATVPELAGVAAEAAAKRRGVPWALKAVEGRRADAARIALAPAAPPQQAPPPGGGNGQAAETAAMLEQMERDRKAAKSPESRQARERALAAMQQRRRSA
jgi:hypothetical protein